jgi:hypothetical protein
MQKEEVSFYETVITWLNYHNLVGQKYATSIVTKERPYPLKSPDL